MTTLGAVTHDGESMYLSTEEHLTAEHGIEPRKALVEEFEEKLMIFLDQARYLYVKDPFVFGLRQTDCN
jgi:hypothetical protein